MTRVTFNKINDVEITALIQGNAGRTPIGEYMFKAVFPGINISGMTGSGKTNLWVSIIPHIADPLITRIWLFSETGLSDPTVKILKDYDPPFELEVSEDLDFDKINKILEAEDEIPILNEEGKIVPKHIFVIDDFPNKIKNPRFTDMCKLIRHRCSIFIACMHDLNNVSPDLKGQLKYALIFPKTNKERFIKYMLEFNFPHNLPEELDALYEVYASVITGTDFLYISKFGEMRKNFNQEISF